MNILTNTYYKIESLIYASKDPFDYIEKNSVINDPNLHGTAASLYNLMIAIGTIGLLITIMSCSIKYTFTKSPDKKRELKSTLLHKGIVGVVFFGFVFFAGIILKISKAFT